jgi:uncharacterized repeat protein (TIGR03803 family)
LFEAKDGAFYGTTSAGGTTNEGTIFRLPILGPHLTSFTYLPNKIFEFSFTGIPGVTYRIDASQDLINWATQNTVTSPTGLNQFTDPAAPLYTQRFYRYTIIP